MAKVIKVIYTVTQKGNGTKKNPFREVEQYWSLKGNLLFEIDDFVSNKLKENPLPPGLQEAYLRKGLRPE